jgi:hypothetical protein
MTFYDQENHKIIGDIKMKSFLLATATFFIHQVCYAGCIGPVIMGECKGTITPFDTPNEQQYDQRAIVTPSGHYAGRVLNGNQITDRNGQYQGQIINNNQLTDSQGRYRGQITNDGMILGPKGQYQGRVR